MRGQLQKLILMNLFPQVHSLICGGKEILFNIGSKWPNQVLTVYCMQEQPLHLFRFEKQAGHISLKANLR